MNGFPKREVVERIRAEFKPGDRVRLLRMDDKYREMPVGLEGTVRVVDDAGTIHVRWDNGSGLGVVYGEDLCEKIGKET